MNLTKIGNIIQKLYTFRYPFDGFLPKKRIKCSYKVFGVPFTRYLNFGEIFKSVYSKYFQKFDYPVKVVVGLSGVDSAYALAELMDYWKNNPNKIEDVNVVNVSFKNYSESEFADKVADFYGLKIEYMKLTESMIKSEISKILGLLGGPFDRGSVIPTYFICQKVQKGEILLMGDSGDAVFKPSMSADYQYIRGTKTLREVYFKLSHKELEQIFVKPMIFEWPYGFLEKAYCNPLDRLRYIEVDSEIPYYYRYRYSCFMKEKYALLPYQDSSILYWSFVDPRASLPDKQYLKNLLTSKFLFNRSWLPRKKPFKIEPEAYMFLEDLMEPELLRNTGWYKFPRELKESSPSYNWIKYFDILTSIWLRSEYENQKQKRKV